MKEKLKQFFETEMHYVKVGLEGETDLGQRNNICWYARQRALGAVDMAQLCGMDFNTAEKMFGEYCNKLEEMEYEKNELYGL